MGSMKLKATPPMVLKKAAMGVPMPKLAALLGSKSSSRKARAMRMPPPMTKGSMWETPFIRSL